MNHSTCKARGGDINPRKAALTAIQATDAGQQVQAALAATGLGGSAYQFCADLVYGVLRCRIRLRTLLAKVLDKPQKLPPLMRIALEMASYSLFFQTKSADYATVNETVKLIKNRFGQNMAQVANGALRKLLSLPQETEPEASLAKASTYYAMPAEITELWQNAYGDKNTLQLLKRSFQRPHAALRVNLRHTQGPDLLLALRQAPDAIAIAHAGVAFPPGLIPQSILGHDLAYWHKQGALTFQQAASQIVMQQLNITQDWQNTPIWDACSGRGGKTAALLEQGLNVALATDRSWQRLRQFAPECKRLGFVPPPSALADASQTPVKTWPGHILADVPCSGLGVLARRPDIKARFALADLGRLQILQEKILQALAQTLTPGHELAYLTCTLNPAENEAQIENLLKQMPELAIVRSWQTPHDSPWLEGMFGLRLRKVASSSSA